MPSTRRQFLRSAGSVAALGVLLGAGVQRPAAAASTGSPRPAFEARTLAAALQALGSSSASESTALQIGAPEVAENGASVPLDISSSLPDTRRIAVLVDHNPQPLALQLEFAPGVRPRFHARIKMGQSSPVRVVAEAGGRHYTTVRSVQVTQGGCGA
jgi:sulfur-oxidizing protein SoxY